MPARPRRRRRWIAALLFVAAAACCGWDRLGADEKDNVNVAIASMASGPAGSVESDRAWASTAPSRRTADRCRLEVCQASGAAGANQDDREEPSATPAAPGIDALGANAACYVCHMSFVREELSKVHLAAKIACTDCHGLSAKHANDENIGATKPDIVYPRDKIDRACSECHTKHRAPARQVVARSIERKLDPKTPAVCTDCHGTHKIERAAEPGAGAGAAPPKTARSGQ